MAPAAQILVVEDEIIVAENIRRRLEKMGYSVPVTVPSGEMAVRKAEENKPDIVLMDIVLQGGMDGVEAADRIRERFNIPVVYLTAYSDDKTLQRAKITEPFGYVIKPFKERELQIAIEIALFKHEMEKKLKESKEWLLITLKSLTDGVIATDPEGCVQLINPAAQSMTGWNPEEAQGKPLRDIFNITSEKTDSAIQTLLIAKDGTRIPIETGNDSIRDDEGNVIGIVVTFNRTKKRMHAMQ